MKISFTEDFYVLLAEITAYIAKDKPLAAKKFKSDLIKNLKSDLKHPFHFKKSLYFENENIRDYVFKGYTCSYEVDYSTDRIIIFAIIKNKNSY